jgi:general secretion pathway protein K
MDTRAALQRGVAVITALLAVALAASTATVMLAQQSAMLGQAALIAARAQADAHGRAGLDWARGVLAQDARTAGAMDTLEEGWAQPIAGLPVERALVSGLLVDEQSKLNLNNLVAGTRRSDPDFEVLERLLKVLELPPELAHAIVDWIDPDSDLSGVSGAEDSYYLALPRPYRAANQPMAQVDELHRIRGFTPERVAKLRPFVTALPTRTAVNINTAPEEVLVAVLTSGTTTMTREDVRALVAGRKGKPFKDRDDMIRRADAADRGTIANVLDTKSGYFVARILVSQDAVELASEALLRRQTDGRTAVLWRRPLY